MAKYYVLAVVVSLVLSSPLLTLFINDYFVREVLRVEDIIGSNGIVLYRFYPCENKLNSNNLLLRVFVSTYEPIAVIVLDYEQFIERYGRGDLYGYLAFEPCITGSTVIDIVYPKGMPCWPIYIEIQGKPGTNIYVEVYVIKSFL